MAKKAKLTKNQVKSLNHFAAKQLSSMFGTEVRDLCKIEVRNGTAEVERPAYGDKVTLTAKELQDCQMATAYSTLNHQAAAYQHLRGTIVPLMAMGFTKSQIDNSGANYYAILQSASSNVIRVLD